MALDRRLRDELRAASSTMPDLPADAVVHSVVVRGHRRRMARRLRIAFVVLAAIAAAAVVSPRVLDEIRSWERPRPATRPPSGPPIITTVAGDGSGGSAGDGGPATEAMLRYPVDLGLDAAGDLYILEQEYPQRVRRVDASGTITTVVGPGAPGEAGKVVLARTFGATGLAVDPEGNVYVAGGEGGFTENRVIRVTPSGDVTTVAGTGEPGFSGDGGLATEAEVTYIWDVAVDARGNLYITANARIRKVDKNGIITTLVGTGTKGFSGDAGPAQGAQVDRLTGVTVDTNGNVYFIDYRNDRIRRIDTRGVITTIAGAGEGRGCFSGDGGPATEASFCGPEHLSVDTEGNIYLADTYNHRIRMIDADGIVTTIAGTGTQGFSGDGGSALQARLSEPSSVAVGPDGAIYIADSGNNRVRAVSA
jgi:sugar lactone lactonase YvrE